MNNTTSVVMFLLMLGLFFASFSYILVDLDKAYPSQSYETSLSGDYDFVNKINNSITPLTDDLKEIQNEKFGWKSFFAGLTAIPNFILAFMGVMLNVFVYAGTSITGFGTELGIPPALIGIVMVMVSVFLVMLLIQWWQGGKK